MENFPVGAQRTPAADTQTPTPSRVNSPRYNSSVKEDQNEMLARTIYCPICCAPPGFLCISALWNIENEAYIRRVAHHSKRLTYVHKNKERQERIDRRAYLDARR